MPGYVIARIDVTDWDRYKEYVKATPAVIAKFGGRFIARAGETITLEGPAETRRVVLLEFPTLEMAKRFYDSPEYKEVMRLRDGAADAQLVAIAGV